MRLLLQSVLSIAHALPFASICKTLLACTKWCLTAIYLIGLPAKHALLTLQVWPAEAVVTGSHCDAIPHAGAYDGTLGVIGAIAAVKGLQAAGFMPKKAIEVLFFTSEEPTRFGFGCIGRYRSMSITPVAIMMSA